MKKKKHLSPWNKYIFSKKPLIFSGITANIIEFNDYKDFFCNMFFNKSNNQSLIDYGVVIENDFCHILKQVQAKSIKYIAHKKNPFVIIIPTTNCNFNCQYCYVKNTHKNNIMSESQIDKIIEFIGKQDDSFHLHWFGGEPTLAFEVIDYFYKRANEKGLKNLDSLLITNGVFNYNKWITLIDKNITKIQFTLDGIKNIHDKRRKFSDSISSFDLIIQNLDYFYRDLMKGTLNRNLKIFIRCNIDKITMNVFIKLREFILDRYNGLFYVYEARIRGIDRNNLSEKEYGQFIKNLYSKNGIICNNYLPANKPKFVHCGNVTNNSYTFTPSNLIYKCPIDTNYEDREIGDLDSILKNNKFNITEYNYLLSTTELLPGKCKKCSLLFLCWGGCPQQRIEHGMKAICPYQKFYLNDFIKIQYSINIYRIQFNNNEITF